MNTAASAQPDPQAARACVESFIAHLKDGNAKAAEKLTIAIDMDGFSFDPEAFPQADNVEIGDVEVQHGLTIVPCEFKNDDHSDRYPAVCVNTADGIRIDLMQSLQLAMGADPSQLMQQVTDQLETVAEGMATAMGAVAETMGQAFGEFADAMNGSSALIGDEHISDDFNKQTALLEEHAIPGAAQQLDDLMDHGVTIDVDWAGTGNAGEAVLLASTGLGIIVSAITILMSDADSNETCSREIQRIMLDWDDDLELPEINHRNQTLSVTLGPFLSDNPPSPILMAEMLKEPIGIQ